ncbi:alpha/beta hydrolase [Halomonas campisalis]|uniref:Alpha/beta hydrolase n=1 Tax=Billgrantia campisalis TaxID=74661 RepID=A0ABS9PAE2_9GAMM|nr:alpha/beta hydrolase [Halomonas campisalis]MCG6658722.1 alpha/beta hydrolase [Halomonas campisalis]MDR5864013.1 alpha/beta hydrolase [Halomonas campisalis]
MSAPCSLTLADGRLAALAWGDSGAPTWLALHGWLDNAASFTRLAPLLVERLGIRVVAIDFSGHGQSHHREGDYALWDYCHDLLDAADELGQQRLTLLGHSMGAGVACLTAAALPERVERLMLIDGLGAVTTAAADAPAQLRKGLRASRRPRSPAPRYPDSETAVAARVAGGVTPIDAETAAPLVQRNLRHEAGGHVRLRTDGRLLWPSPLRLSPEQALALLGAIRCPVLLVEGEGGILGERERAVAARRALGSLTRRVLPGGHHLHLEPAAVAGVAEAIVAWLAPPAGEAM